MAYIGNKLADSYTSFAKQDFTTSATTSYTLDYPVTNANEIALFINFVRQEPTTAYTATGTSLTLTSATSASDDMYCVFLGKALQTVNPPAGSVGASQISDSSITLAKLSATGTKNSTTFLRGDNTFATAGENNTPSWSAKLSSDYNIYSVHGSGVTFKVPFANEIVDTDGAYDATTNYRFTVPTGGAGKYFINSHLDCYNDNTALQQVLILIRKNGSTVISGNTRPTGGANQNILHVCASGIVDLAETDYIEIYANLVYSPGNMYVYSNSMFSGVKLSS